MRHVKRRDSVLSLEIEWVLRTTLRTASLSDSLKDAGGVIFIPAVGIRNLSLEVVRKAFLYVHLQSIVIRTRAVRIKLARQKCARSIARDCRATAANVQGLK